MEDKGKEGSKEETIIDNVEAATEEKEEVELTKKGKPRGHKTQVSKRIKAIQEELFAAYYQGHSPKDISEMFKLSIQTIYAVKRRLKWDERKAKIDDLAKQKLDVDLSIKRGEFIKMTSVLVSQAGSSLMKRAQNNKVDFKVTDFINLTKLYQLMTGEVTERFGIYDKETVKDVINEMSPQDRGLLLTFFDRLEKRMRSEIDSTESQLKLVQ